jgi:DNA-binding LacI/PurR family transcriptional regulator
MTTNLKDIADAVGISSAAVSKYLKDPGTKHVSPETKLRIDEAVRKLNYRANVIAKSLSSKKSDIISILIPYDGPFSSSSFLNEILSGLESALLRENYNMLFPATHGHDSSTMVKNQIAKGFGFDGYVLFGTRYCSLADMEANVVEITKAGFPAVTVNMPELDYEVGQVISVTGAESHPVRHLIDRGHERILLVAGNDSTCDSLEEIETWRRCHAAAGLPVDERLVVFASYEQALAQAAVGRALQDGLDFSAIYCLSDTMALGAYAAVRSLGLRIPEDVSIVGKNNSPFAVIMNPPLTTLRIKLFEIGKRAGEQLLSCIRTGEKPRKTIVPNELMLRESVVDGPKRPVEYMRGS